MSEGLSLSTIFIVSFLAALFAIFVALLVVYSYVTLRLIPKVKRGLRELVGEIGPRAVFERANFDPVETMRQLGISPKEAADAIARQQAADAESVIAYTCEDHGRCVGCFKVLAQFEAIVRHQGEASFDDVERKCYAKLRMQLESDALLDGESETERQKRIAVRVIEALVREGRQTSIAQSVVWSRGKDDRATYATWLSAARSGFEKIVVQDEEDAA
jgi:hypothetical protein